MERNTHTRSFLILEIYLYQLKRAFLTVLGAFMPTPTIEEMLKSNDPKKEISKIRTKYKPNPRKGYVWLGTVIEQKKPFPSWTKVIFENGWIGIPIEALFKQTFILGATGFGKTEFQKNLIYQIISDGGYDVVVADGKGDQDFAKSACSIAYAQGHKTPVVKFGWGESAVFSAFDGDAESVYNRLVTMLSLEPSGDGGVDHFRSSKRELLQLICDTGTSEKYQVEPIEPPRSFLEVENRASAIWLLEAYKDSLSAQVSIQAYTKGHPLSYIHSLKDDVSSATTPFLKYMQPDGFRLGEYPLSFFSIDESVAMFTARYFFRFLAGYVGYYLSQEHKPTVFFCDEFALFGAENVVKLLNTGRSKGGAFVLATQSIGTLGGEQHIADQIVDGPNLKFLFNSGLPEDVIRKFGTGKVADTSHQSKDGEVSGMTTRYVDKFHIDRDELKTFGQGECMFEFGGLVRIQTQMTPELPQYNPDMEVKYQLKRNSRLQSDSSVTAPIPE